MPMLNFLPKNTPAVSFVPARRASLRLRHLPAALLVLGGAAASQSAFAAFNDTISPFIATSYSYDDNLFRLDDNCLLYTSPSPRDATLSRMPSSA